ncbi:MAG: 1-deoxy-D-xylulose-5-phosphate synthase [Bilophila wadsworthia]
MKLLTGRSENFHTLRQLGGISGFPKIEESPFDHFGVGHSSTSVSAALGMAMARDLAGKKNHVLAVIGDGSLTGGLAFEGLNQAGDMGRRLIVVLNDNEMSISHNVGAVSRPRPPWNAAGREVRREVRTGSSPSALAMKWRNRHRTHRSLKTVFTPGMLFEALRFNYIGPVNGHNIEEVERHLRMAASIDDQPVLLHVLTRKGKGYPPAEAQPSKFHGLGKFDVATGQTQPKPAGAPPTYTDIFGETLCRLAKEDDRIVAVTAAMSSGTGTGHFKSRFPTRFTDVGICEQHAVTFAAGLASQGYRPFVAIYSTFSQRAYDQIIHDVCIQKLPVTLCLDRAGLVGEDGPTHHGAFDLSFLRHIRTSRYSPRDEPELQAR